MFSFNPSFQPLRRKEIGKPTFAPSPSSNLIAAVNVVSSVVPGALPSKNSFKPVSV